jgi:uncharacterized membrane protein
MTPLEKPPLESLRSGATWIGWSAVGLGGASLLAGRLGDYVPLQTPYARHLAAGTLQLLLVTLAVGCLACWWAGSARAARWIPALSDRMARFLTAAAVIAYAVGLTALSLVRHRALLTGVWDLGYYTQLTWQLAQFQIPRSSVWHDAPWGNHATFILAVVAPFLRLIPHSATLLVVQSLLLSLGAIPAYILGRRLWGTPLSGLVVAAAYLLYPPLQFANLFDFHADAFATPILLSAFAALFAGRVAWAVAWAALLILVKEDMALVAACFGLYAAVVYRRPMGLALAGVAASAFGLLVWIVIPGWIQTPYFALFNRWLHLGRTPVELVLSPVLQPAAFFGTLLQPERLGYLALLVVPLAGLPLLAPEVLAVGLFPLASNLLSSAEGQYTIRAHYTAALTAVLVAATVVGGERAAAWLDRAGAARRRILVGLVATTLVASLSFSPMPWSRDAFARKQFWNAAPRDGLSRLAAVVPPEASVSAANHLGAHFALRRTLRLFPDGWQTADVVLVDIGGREYVGPTPRPDAFRPLLRSLVETRRLIAVEDGLAAFDRGAPSPDAVARLIGLRAGPVTGPRATGSWSLVGARVEPGALAPRETLWVRYTWTAGTQGTGIPCVTEILAPTVGPPAVRRTRPMFYGLLAASRWPAGTLADEAIGVVVADTALPGLYTWSVTAWHDRDDASCDRPAADVTPLAVAHVRIRPW